jgi:hypothetical protein
MLAGTIETRAMLRAALWTRHEEPRSPSRETASHGSRPTTVSAREPILRRHQHSIRNLVGLTSTYSQTRHPDRRHASPLICLLRRDWRTPRARSAGYGVSARLAGAEVHRLLTGHVMLAKEPYGGAFCLGECGQQHIGSGNLLAAGPLDVGHGTLNDALKGRGRSGVVAARASPARPDRRPGRFGSEWIATDLLRLQGYIKELYEQPRSGR